MQPAPSAPAAAPSRPRDTVRDVLTACGALVAFSLVFRVWAVAGGYFHADDYLLLSQARREGASTVLAAYDHQFMPLGRLIAWVVAQPDPIAWWLLVLTTAVLHAVAAAALAWMLLTVIGTRWATPALLALGLFSPMTLPATMWWAAALNALPMQAALCVAVGAWVQYLRAGSRRWLVVTLSAIGVGLLAYIKAVLIVPLLLLLALCWLGGPRRALRTRAPGLLAVAAVGLLAGVLYLLLAPNPVTGTDVGALAGFDPIAQRESGIEPGEALGLLGTLAMSLVVGAWGGPWRWDELVSPAALADPPIAAVVLAALASLAVVVAGARWRRGALRWWSLLVVHFAGCYAIVLLARGAAVGSLAGREYRYLGDIVPVLVLVLGLVFVGPRTEAGAEGAASSGRRPPRGVAGIAPGTVVRGAWALVALVLVSGLLSQLRYVQVWHERNSAALFVHAVLDDAAERAVVDLSDQPLPSYVVPPFASMENDESAVLPLLLPNVRFPRTTENLAVIAPDGSLHQARIDGVRSATGRTPGCGYAVDEDPQRIVMLRPVLGFSWWARIGYFTDTAGTLRVDTGEQIVEVPLRVGVHNAYVQIEGPFRHVEVSRDDAGGALCLDAVEVGRPVAGEPL